MDARPLFSAATVSYLANCMLGASVALKILDTGRYRWLHHAVYIVTCFSAAVAVGSALVATPRRSARRSAALLAPAALPLAVIPFAGTRGSRHILIALSAAPFFVASVIRAWR